MIDELDHQILKVIQRDGKITYEALAEEVGSAPSTVRDHVKKLQDEGVILGYSTIVDHKRVGIEADALISANIPDDERSRAFASLFSMENVSEILRMTGERRIMFRILAEDNEELVSIINRNIRPLGFEDIKVQMVLLPLIRAHSY